MQQTTRTETRSLKPQDLLLVLKRSKWERDLQRYGSARTARMIYQRQNQSLMRVVSSHERQLANIELLRRELQGAQFIYQEELPFIHKKSFDLLISVGGDNHFVFVSHFAAGRPILGINSDPETSTGALLSHGPKEAASRLRRLIGRSDWNRGLQVCDWSRIEARINYPNGKEANSEACISEISIRSQFHDYISRYLIRLLPKDAAEEEAANPEEHKCSGLLLATGAGSSGWYRNCLPPDTAENPVFAKDAAFFRGVAREPGPRLKETGRLLYTKVRAGEALEVISEMDGEITIDADPNRVYPFPPGAIAHFRLSESTLSVAALR